MRFMLILATLAALFVASNAKATDSPPFPPAPPATVVIPGPPGPAGPAGPAGTDGANGAPGADADLCSNVDGIQAKPGFKEGTAPVPRLLALNKRGQLVCVTQAWINAWGGWKNGWEETLRQTERALTDATDNIEAVRSLLREQIVSLRRKDRTWRSIWLTPVWEAFRLLGGS